MEVKCSEFTATEIETVHKVKAKNYFNETALKDLSLTGNEIIIVLKDYFKKFYVTTKKPLTIYTDRKCMAYTKYGKIEIYDGAEIKMESPLEFTIREVRGWKIIDGLYFT